MTPSRWLDTHIHVSNFDREGRDRGDIVPDLLRVLDQSGSDLRFVISYDSPWTSWANADPEKAHAGNAFIHELVQRAPGRLYGACQPNARFLDESLHTMEVCFEQWGFVMLGEMVQYIFGYMMNSDEVIRLTRQAVEYGVPVQAHISTSNSGPQGQFQGGGTEQLEDLLDLAERVPEANYILAHFIGFHTDNPPVVEGYLDQIDRRFGRYPENFWAEIRDFNSPGVPVALERIPRNRLIAGTDWVTRVGPPYLPYGMVFGSSPEENPYPPSIANMTQFLLDAGCTEDDVDAIACGTAAELLGIGA